MPYLEHPKGVVNILKAYGVYDENTLCAAWLHDTMEDCQVTADLLEKEFNPEIARIVSTLTRNITREEYLDRIKNADFAVQIIKLGDVVQNSSSLFEGIERKTIEQLVQDSKALYFSLSYRIAPRFHEMIKENLKPWASFE
jgi:(p)ppGpp synthase/HD superfamily hydrolase